MERQVNFRDRQELQAADLNNVQEFVDESLQDFIMDAITTERMIVGLGITTPSVTEITVAPGRLWDGPTGKVYDKAESETVSIFSHLPVTDQKWLAVSAIGQEQDTDTQPRDYLVDLDTGQTEPKSVAMESARVAVIQLTTGIESADPQKPEPPTGYTLIGYVRLNTSGVQEILMAENKELMSLFDAWQKALANETWIERTGPKIASIESDLAKLAKMIKGALHMDALVELARDVATLKDKAELPDTYSSYGADVFLDPGESDTENVEYLARVEEGVRFAWDNQTEQQPALFNPLATEVESFDGLILPAHSEVTRLATTGFAGGLKISQYQYTTHELLEGARTKRRIRYGPTREVCTNGVNWNNATYDAQTNVFEAAEGGNWEVLERYGEHGGHYWLRVRQYWVDTWTETYSYWGTVTHNINGCQIAQTFLNGQNGWLKGIDLNFTSRGDDGTVYLYLCETDLGLPDPSRCLTSTSVDRADIQIYPTVTPFNFAQPVFLEAGKHYALIIVTAGDHDVALVQGTEYTHGTIFYSTDGAYYQGDFEKDLMMSHRYAKFVNPRTEVELTTLSLSGGIADLDMLLEAVIPDGSDLLIEYQKEGSGSWYSVIPETAEQLLGLPAMLHMRAVFIGTNDLMPGFYLPGSRIQANRARTDFKHLSVSRVLGSASENIDVILNLENWDETKHTCTVTLLSGGSTYTHDSVTDTEIAGADLPTIRRQINFLPEPGTGISEFQIVVEGATTTALDLFHVASSMYVAK